MGCSSSSDASTKDQRQTGGNSRGKGNSTTSQDNGNEPLSDSADIQASSAKSSRSTNYTVEPEVGKVPADVDVVIDDDANHVSNVDANSRDDKDNTSRVQKRGQRKTQPVPVSQEPINEKGYKKRIREQLRKATSGSDIDDLEHAIHVFEKNRLEDNGDLTNAKERLYFLNLRKELRDAILRRHPGILDKAIYNVESSDYRSELSQSLETAKALRDHLTQLDRYRHDILEMDQSTISELRSYHHPPDGVHEVMMGTYLLLGYEEEKLRDWTDVQCLLGRVGKDSLIREIKNADTVDMDDNVCRRVTKLQSKISQEKIREVSNGAAAFYVWNENMYNYAAKGQGQNQQATPAATPSSKQKQKTSNTKTRPKNQG